MLDVVRWQNMEHYFSDPKTKVEDNEVIPLDDEEIKDSKFRMMCSKLMDRKPDRFEYSVYDYYPWDNYYFANRELLERFSKSSKYDKSYLTYLFETIKEFLPKSLF